MYFVERVNQGDSLASWLNWLTEPPAVCWSVIMGDLSASCKGENWTLPKAFRTGPGSCAVHSIQIYHQYRKALMEQWSKQMGLFDYRSNKVLLSYLNVNFTHPGSLSLCKYIMGCFMLRGQLKCEIYSEEADVSGWKLRKLKSRLHYSICVGIRNASSTNIMFYITI